MNCRLQSVFAARLMMTRRCAGRASRNCLVSFGTRTSTGNPRIRGEGQACCSRAIGHPYRFRHRSSEKSPLSGARRNRTRRSRIDHRWYSLCGVVPGAWKKGDNSNDLARSATRKSVAPASRLSRCKRGRRFFRIFNTVPARYRNPVTTKTFLPLPSPTRSGQ